MLHRSQIVVALVLLLILGPLASAACGAQCLHTGVQSTQAMHSAMAGHHCVRDAACCHSQDHGLCVSTQSPVAIAEVASAKAQSQSQDVAALPVVAVIHLVASADVLAAHAIDTSPPGQSRTPFLTTLRI